MQSIQLKIARRGFMSALATLGRFRRKRSVAILPVWLNLVAKTKELQIVEDKGAVTAYVQAEEIGRSPERRLTSFCSDVPWGSARAM
jgi:hypothetical protein